MTIEEAIKSTQPIPLHNKTVINLMYTSRFVENKENSFKDYDLTLQQYNVLRILKGRKGIPANLSDLQERMIDRNSNTTRLVDKLILKKLVDRQICPSNRRKVEISITKKGITLLQEMNPIVESHNKSVTQNLNKKELETLNLLLDKLRND